MGQNCVFSDKFYDDRRRHDLGANVFGNRSRNK